MSRKTGFWYFCMALLAPLPALAGHGDPPVPDQPLIIDVRTTDEYQQGHVREAENIPFDEIATHIIAVAPNHDARIVLYCRSGRRASIAEQTLRQLGYQQVENQGGLSDMLRNGYSE